MNQAVTTIMVLLTTFIAAGFAFAFVSTQTFSLNSYSKDFQNSSVCEGLATRAQNADDEAEERYNDKGCDEIYGEIEFTSQVVDNSEILEGVTLNSWKQYYYYDTKNEFEFTIDYEELDGQEMLNVHQSFPNNNDEFVYNEDWNYEADFYIAHPTESGQGWQDTSSWIRDIDGDCEGAECDYNTTFNFSERGNLTDNFLPCHVDSGEDNDDFVQRLAIQAYDDNGNLKGWGNVQNHDMTLLDWGATECWTENAYPSFKDGEIVVKDMEIPDPIMIDEDHNLIVEIDEYQSQQNYKINASFPNQDGNRVHVNVAEKNSCSGWCSFQFELDLDDELEADDCSDDPSLSDNNLHLYIAEGDSSDPDDYHLIYNQTVYDQRTFGTGIYSQTFNLPCW